MVEGDDDGEVVGVKGGRGEQSASRARCGLQRVRSGDEGLPVLGRRLGMSRLRRVRLLSLIASTTALPPPAASGCRSWRRTTRRYGR